jgi:hypothetical protein
MSNVSKLGNGDHAEQNDESGKEEEDQPAGS